MERTGPLFVPPVAAIWSSHVLPAAIGIGEDEGDNSVRIDERRTGGGHSAAPSFLGLPPEQSSDDGAKRSLWGD